MSRSISLGKASGLVQAGATREFVWVLVPPGGLVVRSLDGGPPSAFDLTSKRDIHQVVPLDDGAFAVVYSDIVKNETDYYQRYRAEIVVVKRSWLGFHLRPLGSFSVPVGGLWFTRCGSRRLWCASIQQVEQVGTRFIVRSRLGYAVLEAGDPSVPVLTAVGEPTRSVRIADAVTEGDTLYLSAVTSPGQKLKLCRIDLETGTTASAEHELPIQTGYGVRKLFTQIHGSFLVLYFSVVVEDSIKVVNFPIYHLTVDKNSLELISTGVLNESKSNHHVVFSGDHGSPYVAYQGEAGAGSTISLLANGETDRRPVPGLDVFAFHEEGTFIEAKGTQETVLTIRPVADFPVAVKRVEAPDLPENQKKAPKRLRAQGYGLRIMWASSQQNLGQCAERLLQILKSVRSEEMRTVRLDSIRPVELDLHAVDSVLLPTIGKTLIAVENRIRIDDNSPPITLEYTKPQGFGLSVAILTADGKPFWLRVHLGSSTGSSISYSSYTGQPVGLDWNLRLFKALIATGSVVSGSISVSDDYVVAEATKYELPQVGWVTFFPEGHPVVIPEGFAGARVERAPEGCYLHLPREGFQEHGPLTAENRALFIGLMEAIAEVAPVYRKPC